MRLLVSILTLALAGLTAHAQTYTYDAAGRLTRVTWPNGRAIAYTYDVADNLLSATPTSVPPAPAATSAVEASPGQNRISWAPEGAAPSSWIVQRKSPGGQWETVATIPGAATSYVDADAPPAAEYRVAAVGASGPSAWSRAFQASSASSVELSVPRIGVASLVTRGDRVQVTGGHVPVDVESGSVPYGSAIFSLVLNGTLVTESAVPASPPTRRVLLAVEHRRGITSSSGQFQGTIDTSTALGIANPGKRAVEIDLTLRDREARIVATGRGAIGPSAHGAYLIEDLRTIAPGFIVPPEFANDSGVGTLELSADAPISVMALRVTTNQRNDILFTSTAVADLSDELVPGPIILPHFAEGGGFTTAISLFNPSTDTLTGTLRFFEGNGTPAQLPTVAHGSETSLPYRIPARGALLIETLGTGDVRAGWVHVVPDGEQVAPRGAMVFRLGQNGVVIAEAGVPIAMPSTRSRIWVDRRNGRETAAAIANASGSPATVRFRAFGADGVTAATEAATMVLPANGHTSTLAQDLVGALPAGFFGVLEVESSTPIAALSLRFLTNTRNELVFSTSPVADLTRPAPWPVYFPHIAEGGGFRTELVFLGPLTPARVRANLLDDSGAPLPVAVLP